VPSCARRKGAPANAQRPPEGLGLLYDATLCVGCKACVAACKRPTNNPAEFNTDDKLWDTPLDTSGHTFNLIKMYRNGTMETVKDSEQNGFAFMKPRACTAPTRPACRPARCRR
jgi:Fe-S-cluster-containing dehydrogenase component